jgi:hypothetical protein
MVVCAGPHVTDDPPREPTPCDLCGSCDCDCVACEDCDELTLRGVEHNCPAGPAP